jgi:hypothetical protein
MGVDVSVGVELMNIGIMIGEDIGSPLLGSLL